MFCSIYIFILGTIFGSFFYVVGTRLPNNESLLRPRSHCTYCNHFLKWFELIPLFSYLILRGKCLKCNHKLSKEYLLYELFAGVLFFLSYLKFGVSYEFFIALILSSLTILIFITDFKYMLILDSPLLISSLFVIILKYLYYGANEVFFSVLCGVFSFLIMLVIGKIGTILFKKEALGGGDIKFAFVMGLALSQSKFIFNSSILLSVFSGSRITLIALVFSTFLALPYAIASMLLKKDNEVPFGPFLASSTLIVFFFLEKFKYIFFLF